jgi:2-oxoglutarate dehydrogenase complex dehydrogenase (E1) component-like enzyme
MHWSAMLIFSRSPWFSVSLFAGQVYHTLLQEREERSIKDVAISRVEQISPFPYDLVSDRQAAF